jgi:UDP-glucose 4-epimerase
MARIAVTGTESFLGSRLLRRLVETRGPDAVVAVDVAAPPATLAGVRHRRVDLTEPASDQQVLDVLQEEDVDTVVHLAFFTNPRRDASYAHELESIGTLNLLAASAAAKVGHFLMRSFTAVYGASGRNPNFLTERQPLGPDPSLGWVREKLEAEEHAASFSRRYPGLKVAVLRFAPLLGPGVRTFYTRAFDRRVVTVVMGHDPLLQLLHPADAVSALEAALERRAAGAFNVVPRGSPLPLLTALHLAMKVPVPVPHPIARAGLDLLWAVGLAEAPGGFVDYVRYLFVADGSRAERELGFRAVHDSRQSLMAYLQYRHPEEWRVEVEAPA